jgi:hypothetical protein
MVAEEKSVRKSLYLTDQDGADVLRSDVQCGSRTSTACCCSETGAGEREFRSAADEQRW